MHSNLIMSVHHALTSTRLSVTTKFAFVVTVWVRSFRLCLVLTFIELDVFIPVFDPVLCEILIIFECLHDGNICQAFMVTPGPVILTHFQGQKSLKCVESWFLINFMFLLLLN